MTYGFAASALLAPPRGEVAPMRGEDSPRVRPLIELAEAAPLPARAGRGSKIPRDCFTLLSGSADLSASAFRWTPA